MTRITSSYQTLAITLPRQNSISFKLSAICPFKRTQGTRRIGAQTPVFQHCGSQMIKLFDPSVTINSFRSESYVMPQPSSFLEVKIREIGYFREILGGIDMPLLSLPGDLHQISVIVSHSFSKLIPWDHDGFGHLSRIYIHGVGRHVTL